MIFNQLVLAGTFDHFHLGHRKFIKTALKQSNFAFCGITKGWITKNKKFIPSLQTFKTRVQSLKKFLKKNSLDRKVKIFVLNNPFGPSISNFQIEALAATKESLKGAKLVNKKRAFLGLKPLPIIIVDLVLADDHQRISSTRIRLGEINRRGFVYQQLMPKNKTLYLPQNKRVYFKKPIAKLLTGMPGNLSWASLKAKKSFKKHHFPFIITVGDIASQTLSLKQLPIDLAIVDSRCQRQAISFNLTSHLRKKADFLYLAKNDPGTISPEATAKIKKSLFKILTSRQAGIVQITGEEDLLVLPSILLAPLQTVIFYGQPKKGLVQIIVTEKTKEKARNLFKLFLTG